jgi:hypothetical protein
MRIDICAREDEVTQLTLLEVLTSIGAFSEDDSPLDVPFSTGLHRFRVGFEILTVFVDTWLVDLEGSDELVKRVLQQLHSPE